MVDKYIHFLWSSFFMIFHFISEINRCENKSEIKISFLTFSFIISRFLLTWWMIIKGGLFENRKECIVYADGTWTLCMLKGKTFETHYKSLPIVKKYLLLAPCNNKSQTTFQIIIIIVIMMMKSLSLSLTHFIAISVVV